MSCGLTAAGFFFWWPIAVLGVAVAALSGLTWAALVLGLLLDLLWGAPTGAAHYLFFPVVLSAVGLVGVRLLARRVMLDRGLQERL